MPDRDPPRRCGGHDRAVDVEIREPRIADGPSLGRMHYASWLEAYEPLLPEGFFGPATEARWIARWEVNLADPAEGTVSRIAVRDGGPVGLASAGPARPNETAGPPAAEHELWSLYVRASEYGTGLASRLLDAVLPAGPAELWVFEANARARAFYAKHGFAPDGARHVFGQDLGNQAEIRMVR